ncbi:MAG: hypothetical protein HAW67_06910 [Endozoicomonadaceae bacterium]|nr:hypothetical protein [Endozoicomonadaceae bacterium]
MNGCSLLIRTALLLIIMPYATYAADKSATDNSVIDKDLVVDKDFKIEEEIYLTQQKSKQQNAAIHREALLKALGGLPAEDILAVRQATEVILKAKTQLLSPINPKQEVKTLSLAPGAGAFEINTREGFITTLSFVDSIGNPWPVLWALPGNQAYEEITNPTEDKKATQHLIVLKATEKYHITNYTVALKGLDDPIIFILKNGTDRTDFKITFKIPKIGPNTDPSTLITPSGVNAIGGKYRTMLDISSNELDRFYVSPPEEAQFIPTTHPDIATVWFYKGDFVIKTRAELVADYKQMTPVANDWKIYVLRKPEYELLFVNDDGAVRVGLPVDRIHQYAKSIQKHNKESVQ